MDVIVKNWKTSVMGLAALGLTAAMLMRQIDVETYLGLLGGVTGVGLLLGRDAKKEQ